MNILPHKIFDNLNFWSLKVMETKTNHSMILFKPGFTDIKTQIIFLIFVEYVECDNMAILCKEWGCLHKLWKSREWHNLRIRLIRNEEGKKWKLFVIINWFKDISLRGVTLDHKFQIVIMIDVYFWHFNLLPASHNNDFLEFLCYEDALNRNNTVQKNKTKSGRKQ